MKKRLVDSLDMIVAVPDVQFSVSTENMINSWSGMPYAELSVIVVNLRYLAIVHQTHHWTAKGDPFYGDHLLFERLYNTVNDEIDEVAEKAVGLGGIDNVSIALTGVQLAKLCSDHEVEFSMPNANSLARRSLAAEVEFLRVVGACVESLEGSGLLTRGVDNMLAGIQDTHENNVYLLKQRVGSGGWG